MTDIVHVLPTHPDKTYTTRPLEEVNTLTIHHTVGWAAGGDILAIAAIARFHVNTRDWPGIGYHYVIGPAGDIYRTNYHETWSFHVGLPGNAYAVGIALGGDFTNHPPSQAQQDAAQALVACLRGELEIIDVLPHRRMPGGDTQCPGNTWEQWFPYVAGE